MAKPSHIAKIAREYEGTDGGKKTAWTDISVAWSIKEGKSSASSFMHFPSMAKFCCCRMKKKPKAEPHKATRHR